MHVLVKLRMKYNIEQKAILEKKKKGGVVLFLNHHRGRPLAVKD